MSEIESPACDLVVWNSLKYQHKKIALLGESYLNCFGCVPQEELNHRSAYACFSPWLDTSRYGNREKLPGRHLSSGEMNALVFYQNQCGEKGSNQFSARKPKDNLEGEEAEPFLYITIDYNLDISPPSWLISLWASWMQLVYIWYSMQSGVLPQLTVAIVLTAKGKTLLTVRVHLFLVALPDVPSQLNVSMMTAFQHCRAFRNFYSTA